MKNRDILLDVIGDTDENLIPGLSAGKRKSRIVKWGFFAACLCLAAVGAAVWMGSLRGGTTDNMLLVAAAYPEIPMYPVETDGSDGESQYYEWLAAKRALRDQPEDYKDGFNSFFLSSTRTFLTGSGDDNKIFSPLSLFMALSMSAEISEGNTRRQILDVLSQNDMDSLRSHAKSIWQANYMDDGMAKCVLATSLWTNSKIPYTRSTVDSLADNYYASVYSGDPGSDEYNKLLRDWINGQTDGLLENFVSDIRMNPDTGLALASTVNYSGKWKTKFSKAKTESGIFHSPSGEIECDFMNDERNISYYWGEKFTSVSMWLENNGHMRLILPDEGIAPEDLINDDEALAYMMNTGKYENVKYLIVNLSVPKFDISSDMDLKEGLERLGITDAFDPVASDFSPLTKQADGVCVESARQNTRVMIDEDGCKASSLTAMLTLGDGMPPDEHVDFILDRPFLFEIVSDTGLPLFVGIVNNPIP